MMAIRQLSTRAAMAIAVAAILCSQAPVASAAVAVGDTADYASYQTTVPGPTLPPSPINFSSFRNVGVINGLNTGVYLGNGYVLTAAHVGPGTFTLPNVPGSPSYLSAGRGTYLYNSDGTAADLLLFQLQTPGGLPAVSNLSIGTTSPVAGTSNFYLAGNGVSRKDQVGDSDIVQYDADFNKLSSGTGAYSGYELDTTGARQVRYGTASTGDADPMKPGIQDVTTLMSDGVGTQSTFATDFTDTAGAGIAADHDSGGGVFDASGTLRGTIITLTTYDTQPDNTVIFGNQANAVDLSQYRQQIYDFASLPEPSALGFFGLFGFLGIRRRRAP